MKIRQVSRSLGLISILGVSLTLLGCPAEGDKSPFATENVSVAPQVQGRAPAPTPIAPPPAAVEPTPESE
jgi:hypothetical protein